MTEPARDNGHGSGHDRSARERDVLRELHELTGRPRSGEPPIRLEAGPGSSGARGDPPAGEDRPPAQAR